MLYVTTRNNRDAFTAQRALQESRGPDGGLFVPFRWPELTPEDISTLGDRTSNSCTAQILNLLFGTKLTERELDLTLGRHCVRLNRLDRRTVMAEAWHNPDGCFSATVTAVTRLLQRNGCSDPAAEGWVNIGARIAVLFGIFAQVMRQGLADGEKTVDISLVSGDFSAPMAAWYARSWGLPIGNIVCCCNENGNLWDFFCHGQLRTDGVAVRTRLPLGDVCVPAELERLIHAAGGPEEVARYLDAVRRGSTYYAEGALLQQLRRGMYVTVSSEKRVLSAIPSAYATHRYLLSPYAALAYGGLQDYRARTAENRCALILGERSPGCEAQLVCDAMGISRQQLEQYLIHE